MHPHEVEGDCRRHAQQPARPRLPVAVVVTVIVASVVAVVWRWLAAASGAAHLRHAVIQLAQVAGPVGLDLRVVRRRGGGPVRHARVPRQPVVQVAHARLVHAEDQEGRQAVGATLADIRLPRPARAGPRLLELVGRRISWGR